ncbi:hypothetical protein [Ruegeria sp. ANG-R]|uniref:hypothetical protein n=1 Tax=Ruegeria sp. ANG-R TaxID=1577903 RepID=UPI00126A288F|nr:hypothetical protein [Ruegeria sp. ANG-R]
MFPSSGNIRLCYAFLSKTRDNQMVFRVISGFTWVLLAFAGPAQAAEWQSGEASNGAWSMIQEGQFNLRVSCWPGDPSFFFVLTGGPFNGMQNIDDGNESMMMWIELPDGRTARHPIDGHYFAPDKAFVGRFIVSDFVLEEFRQGAKLSLTSPTGVEIAAFGMQGTGKARGHFKQACGI